MTSPRQVVEALCQRLGWWTLLPRLGPTGYEKVVSEQAGNCIDLASLLCAAALRCEVSASYVLLGSWRESFPALMHAWTVVRPTDRESWMVVDPQDMRPRPTTSAEIESSLTIVAMYNDLRVVMSPADRQQLWEEHSTTGRTRSERS